MRILHVITGLSTGGAETMLLKLLLRLDASCFDCSVVSLSDLGTVGVRIADIGVPVHALGMRGGVSTPTALWRLRQITRKFRPSLIQGWMPHGNLASLAVSHLFFERPPVAWNVRQCLYSLAYERPLTAVLIRLGARLSNRPAAIIYNSKTSASQHEALGYKAQKRRIIPNGFDCDRYAPDILARAAFRRGLGLGNDALLFGLAARYHPMKDHATFLRSAAKLRACGEDAHFILAGEGIDDKNVELQCLVEQLGLHGCTHMLAGQEDMPAFFAALDIAISSSWSEAFPNAIGEAMACGVPCVATDVGDSSYIVGNSGVVVPPRDPDAMAAALKQCIDMGIEGRKTLGKKARQRIQSFFSLDSTVAEYETLYESLGLEGRH